MRDKEGRGRERKRLTEFTGVERSESTEEEEEREKVCARFYSCCLHDDNYGRCLLPSCVSPAARKERVPLALSHHIHGFPHMLIHSWLPLAVLVGFLRASKLHDEESVLPIGRRPSVTLSENPAAALKLHGQPFSSICMGAARNFEGVPT